MNAVEIAREISGLSTFRSNGRAGVVDGRTGRVSVVRSGVVRRLENGGLSARSRRHVVGVDVRDVLRRCAQPGAQAGRRVGGQPFLQVLQRRLERAHHTQLQPTQPSQCAPLSVPTPSPLLSATYRTRRTTPPIYRVWCGCS